MATSKWPTDSDLEEIREYIEYWRYGSTTRTIPRGFSRAGGVFRLEKALAEIDALCLELATYQRKS